MPYTWPSSIRPSTASFWLEANTAANVSPLSRATQVLIRQGARWRCDLTFNARKQLISGQIDGLLAVLDGPGTEVLLFDFRRPLPLGTARLPILTTFTDTTIFTDGTEFVDTPHLAYAQAAGQDILYVAGLLPNSGAFIAGDYIGLNGYLYLICQSIETDGTGLATIQIRPRLRAQANAGDEVNINAPAARFRLADNQQGTNRTQPGMFSTYTVSFLESLP